MRDAKRRSPDKELWPPAGPAIKPFNAKALLKLTVPLSSNSPRAASGTRLPSPSLSFSEDSPSFSPQTVLAGSLLACTPSPCESSDCPSCLSRHNRGRGNPPEDSNPSAPAPCMHSDSSKPFRFSSPTHRVSRSISSIGSIGEVAPDREQVTGILPSRSFRAKPPPSKVRGSRSSDMVSLIPSLDAHAGLASASASDEPQMGMVQLRPCKSAPPQGDSMCCDTPRGRRLNRGFVLPDQDMKRLENEAVSISGQVADSCEDMPDAVSMELSSPRLPVRRSSSLTDDSDRGRAKAMKDAESASNSLDVEGRNDTGQSGTVARQVSTAQPISFLNNDKSGNHKQGPPSLQLSLPPAPSMSAPATSAEPPPRPAVPEPSPLFVLPSARAPPTLTPLNPGAFPSFAPNPGMSPLSPHHDAPKPLSPLSGASVRPSLFLGGSKRSNLGPLPAGIAGAGDRAVGPSSPLTLNPQSSPLRRRVDNTRLKRKRPPIIEIPTKGCFTSSPMNTPPPEILEEVVEEEAEADEGFAALCKKGKREKMEDCHRALPKFGPTGTDAFFGIFDGHSGTAAARFSSSQLPLNVLQAAYNGAADRPTAMKQAFKDTDAQFLNQSKTGGTCVVSLWLTPGSLTVAHAGDCRAVLSRSGSAHPLTWDHKASREDERTRIEALGGHIDCYKGGVWRVNGMLAVTRAIGDAHLKEVITSEPEVTQVAVTSDCEFVIMASDGLWDKVTNQEAVDVVRECVVVPPPVSSPVDSSVTTTTTTTTTASTASSTGLRSSNSASSTDSSSLMSAASTNTSSSFVHPHASTAVAAPTAATHVAGPAVNTATASIVVSAAAAAAAAAGGALMQAPVSHLPPPTSPHPSLTSPLHSLTSPARQFSTLSPFSPTHPTPSRLTPRISPASLADRCLRRHHSDHKVALNDAPVPPGCHASGLSPAGSTPSTPRDVSGLSTPRFSPSRGFGGEQRGGGEGGLTMPTNGMDTGLIAGGVDGGVPLVGNPASTGTDATAMLCSTPRRGQRGGGGGGVGFNLLPALTPRSTSLSETTASRGFKFHLPPPPCTPRSRSMQPPPFPLPVPFGDGAGEAPGKVQLQVPALFPHSGGVPLAHSLPVHRSNDGGLGDGPGIGNPSRGSTEHSSPHDDTMMVDDEEGKAGKHVVKSDAPRVTVPGGLINSEGGSLSVPLNSSGEQDRQQGHPQALEQNRYENKVNQVNQVQQQQRQQRQEEVGKGAESSEGKLREKEQLQLACRRLVEKAVAAGSIDDVGVMVVMLSRFAAP